MQRRMAPVAAPFGAALHGAPEAVPGNSGWEVVFSQVLPRISPKSPATWWVVGWQELIKWCIGIRVIIIHDFCISKYGSCKWLMGCEKVCKTCWKNITTFWYILMLVWHLAKDRQRQLVLRLCRQRRSNGAGDIPGSRTASRAVGANVGRLPLNW